MKFKFDNFIKYLLAESVTFSVTDAENPVQDILGMAFALNKPFYAYMDKNMSKEEQADFQKQRASEVLTADGDDYDKSEGVLNFYTAGIPEKLVKPLVSLLKYYIGEHDAVLLNGDNIPLEKSNIFNSPVYRFKIKIGEAKNPAPELNLSNMNARAILCDVLNYPSDTIEEYGSIPLAELLMKIGYARDNDFAIGKAERKDTQEGNFYTGGLSKERIADILAQLEKICEWGVKNDYSSLSLS